MATFTRQGCAGCSPTNGRADCPLVLGRRNFLTTAGASALGLKMGLLDFASSLFAGEPNATKKPVIRVVFARPKDQKGYWWTFTGPIFDGQAHQAEYTRIMTDAAKEMGVQLEVDPKPLVDQEGVNALLERCKKLPPDGVIFAIMCHPQKWWNLAKEFVEKRGDIPTIMFSPAGTAFTANHAATRNAPKTFQAATQDSGWLAHGVRMLNTIGQMKRTRLCILKGDKTEDQQVEGIGTTLHYIPLRRWYEEFDKTKTTDEMKAIVDYYRKEAKEVVEPKLDNFLAAAKCYVMARKIMAAEKCHGISVDCMKLSETPGLFPCLAWSKLNDELVVGACEADVDAAISLLLTNLLFQRPGFMQDPFPNTINNTLIGAHCSCPIKLNGPDKPHVPFTMRSQNGVHPHGCATKVLWQPGQEVTVMQFDGPGKMILGTGRVVSNIAQPPAGGCRTSVELEMDDVADTRDCKGFHQVFIYGKLDRELKAYCQLAGIKVVHI